MATKSNRIRILYTIPNFDTAGSGKALLNIAMGLNANEFEPHIMCMHDRGEFFKVVRASGIPVHLFNYTTSMKPYWKGLLRCWKISRYFKKINPDIIHSFHYSADYSEALAARLAGIKWMYTKKNMIWGGSSVNAWKLRTRLASAIILLNRDMNFFFLSSQRKTFYIPRGIDMQYFSTNSVRDFHDVNLPNQRFIVCVANLVPIKGVESLLDAFALIKAAFPDWALCIVGDDTTPYARTLKNRTQELGIFDNVIFTGKKLDVRSYLAASEIFVLPTLERGEGFPVVIAEAMAMGLVVFGSNVPGIRDQLEKFPSFLFKAGDSAELADKLAGYMSRSKAELKQIGGEFRNYCVQHFTAAREIKSHEEVYRKLVNKGVLSIL